MKVFDLINNNYGFRWGDVLVERLASNDKKPKFQVLRLHFPKGNGIDILIRPRSVKITKFEKEGKC